MPKRTASTDLSCAGCRTAFDSEIHIPFMGSCGDSICAVCLNEKKIKICPECNLEGGFAWNQKNTLAMKLLSSAAEMEATDSKKAKLDVGEETNAPGEPVSAILDPKNLPFLAQIVNQLNPPSFLNLASTCKTLHSYCFNSNDIKIVYDIHSISVTMDGADSFKFGIQETPNHSKVEEDDTYKADLSLDYTGYRHGFLSSAVGRKKLQKYPFDFRLNELMFHDVDRFDNDFFTPLRTLLAEFPTKTVHSFHVMDNVKRVFPAVSEDFMQFFKDFRIMYVNFWSAEFDGDVNEEYVNYFLQNTASFYAAYPNITERLLLNASVPRLHLNISLSERTFVDLIKKFADSTDEIRWDLYCERFELHDALRSFKLLPFDHEGPLPDEHPIVFVKDNEPRECWLLRKDGKVMKCRTSSGFIFSMCSLNHYPPCLCHNVDKSEREVLGG